MLNWATYMCTLENDSLTTSVVGRTKSIVQTLGGLFAFGDVQVRRLLCVRRADATDLGDS